MWALSPTSLQPCPPLLHKPRKPQHTTFLPTINSATCKPPNRALEGPDEETQRQELSGNDVLWALQRATAKKNKGSVSKKKKGSKKLSVEGGNKSHEDGEIDYSNVKPLCLKEEWGIRLDELERRLKELSEGA